jgi:hypothetical protein
VIESGKCRSQIRLVAYFGQNVRQLFGNLNLNTPIEDINGPALPLRAESKKREEGPAAQNPGG